MLLSVSFYISSTGDPVFISLTSVTARKAASYVQTLKALKKTSELPICHSKIQTLFMYYADSPFHIWVLATKKICFIFFSLKDIVVWQERQSIEVHFIMQKSICYRVKKIKNKNNYLNTAVIFSLAQSNFPFPNGTLLIILFYSRKNKATMCLVCV